MRDFLKTGWAAQRRNIFKKLCLSEIAERKVNRGSRNLRLFLPGDRGVQEKNESIKLLSVPLIKNCSHLKMSTRANKHLFTFAFSVTQIQGLNPRASTNVLHVIYSSWNIYEADFKSGFIYQHSLFLSASYPAHCNTTWSVIQIKSDAAAWITSLCDGSVWRCVSLYVYCHVLSHLIWSERGWVVWNHWKDWVRDCSRTPQRNSLIISLHADMKSDEAAFC